MHPTVLESKGPFLGRGPIRELGAKREVDGGSIIRNGTLTVPFIIFFDDNETREETKEEEQRKENAMILQLLEGLWPYRKTPNYNRWQ